MAYKKNKAEEAHHRLVLKVEVLSHYGKGGHLRCCWVGCNITDVDMLTIDHVDNDGNKNKCPGGLRRGGNGLHRYLKSNDFPPGHQTLCANHQLKKELLRRRKKRG
jgi:hypothetical protein